MITDIDPPPIEPVTLDYAKIFLRVDTDDDNQLISDLIKGSRLRVEDMIGASLITRRRLYMSHSVPERSLFINHTPVTAVHRVGIIAPDCTVTDVPVEDYTVSLRAIPAAVCLNSVRWSDYADPVAVEVEIEAGYGTTADDVPMQLRQAILLLLAQSYEHRDSETQPPLPMMVDALTMPYRGLRL